MSVTIQGSNQIVKQVIQATTNTNVTTTSGTYVTTGFSATITPTSTSSKVLVFLTLPSNVTANNGGMGYQLVRNGSAIITFMPQANLISLAAGVGANYSTASFVYLDSPVSSSALTYTVFFAVTSGGTASMCPGSNHASITLQEISGS
jgi:hypothetical protein